MDEREKIELAESVLANVEAEDFDELVGLFLTLIVRNNPKYAPFFPLASRLLRGVFERLRKRADGECRWYNPFSWF